MDQLWAQVPCTKTRQHVHLNTCLETFNLWVTAERILWRHQQQFSINVWAGIVGECLVGPHVLPHQLAGNHYQDFLLHDLPMLLEDVSLAVRARMWYKHDGALAHFSRAVRNVLNNTYHNQWMGRGGPTAWPPCSPDSNPLDFYRWGTPRNPCICSSCWHFTIALWCLSDYLQQPQHLWTDAAVHAETCRGVHWISWRTFWALIINVLFQQ
jgi:hypothetical protein